MRIILLILNICICATAAAENIGIYGGTFDPPHKGHFATIEAAIKAAKLDEVIVIVSESTERKNGKLDVETRRALAEKEFAGEPKVRFMTESELADYRAHKYNGFVHDLTSQHPGNNYFAVTGSDVVADIQAGKYKALEEPNLRYVTMNRGEIAATSINGKPVIQLQATPDTDISSTDIRAAIAKGEDVSTKISPQTHEEIFKRALYAPSTRRCMDLWNMLLHASE